MNTATQNTSTETTHPFERAGLGKAPFKFRGMVDQDIMYGEVILNRAEYERTGVALTTKRGGTCAYCGTAIQNMFKIESSDGRKFHVGCECVNKTGDVKLVASVKKAVNAANGAKRAAKAVSVAGELKALLADDATRARLSSQPHPMAWRAEQGATLLDWAVWMAERAGATGRAKALKVVKG